MKKINFTKIASLLVVIILTACNKEECVYENEIVACAENEPEGYMVTTMEDFNGSTLVAAIYKTTFNGSAPVGGDWNNPALGSGQVGTIATPSWNLATIGHVFGIAIDNPNIYLAATDVYRYDSFGVTSYGTGGSAGIYKTNITTPGITNTLVTTLVANTGYTVGTNQIPNSGVDVGNSIGNIAFDKTHNQLFATNLEDGRIYRIDPATGNIKSILDPFVVDSPSNGMVAVNERIWGIGVLTQNGSTEVYFARTEATYNSIWSIKLDASGEFIATSAGGITPKLYLEAAPKLEIQKVGTQNKISDIEFSCSGKMLMAERGDPHSSSIFEYKKVGVTWSLTNPFYVGGFSGANSAGGVDYGGKEVSGSFVKDGLVWGSQNFGVPALNNPLFYPGLNFANLSYLAYGVEGIDGSGNAAATNGSTDLYIDANAGGANNKGGIGDVDVFDSNCPCND